MEEQHNHHHEHHHTHHHHHDSTIQVDDSVTGEIKRLMSSREKGKKRKDSTSKFRDAMFQRSIRNKLIRKFLWCLMVLIAILLSVAFIFAYCIDSPNA